MPDSVKTKASKNLKTSILQFLVKINLDISFKGKKYFSENGWLQRVCLIIKGIPNIPWIAQFVLINHAIACVPSRLSRWVLVDTLPRTGFHPTSSQTGKKFLQIYLHQKCWPNISVGLQSTDFSGFLDSCLCAFTLHQGNPVQQWHSAPMHNVLFVECLFLAKEQAGT